MTVLTTPNELQVRLADILSGDKCTLFAGAGISAFAGLRTWGEYLTALAASLERYEPDLAVVMRKRIARGLFLEAAHLYIESTDMPSGEKLRQLVQMLKTDQYDPSKLLPLVSLPFEAVVTTNYDRALIEAWAKQHKSAPVCIEKNDPTFKSAAFLSQPFIARIHGREEVPQEMVLETRNYADLERDAVYQDFLHNLFLRRRCLFLGFSFLDPAISDVLEFIQKRGVFPKLHYAVVPAQAATLIERLAKSNIEVILYDARDKHAVLWEAIQLTRGRNIEPNQEPGGTRLSAFETARRLLAICYTRARLGKDVLALRTLVVEGIVISLISSGETTGAKLRGRLREFLAVTDGEAESLIEEALSDLQSKQICHREADQVSLRVDLPEPSKTQPIRQLVAGTLHRLMVRDHYDPSTEVSSKLVPIIEEVIVLRGWDLGAEFAGAHVEEEVNALPTIEKAIERHLGIIPPDRKRQIRDALTDLMRHPTPKEEHALGDLGRLAFGIEVVLQAGRSTMYATSFPDTVYLDASVVMPAVTHGHPYQTTYWNAITTVQEKSGTTSEIYVADVFLEEIYSHRNNSERLADELQLNRTENLKAFIGYFGPANTNVFVGAYSTYVANEDRPQPFSEFLKKEAPYKDEVELTAYLEKLGIRTAWTKARSETEIRRYADIRSALLEAYDVIEADVDQQRRKRPVLKQHEANQLALLEQAIEAGKRAVFVTADGKLRRAIRASRRLRPLLDSVISHLGLIQLVDLLVGLNVDPGALRRLLWTVQVADAATALKNYLLARALEQYDAALVFRMGDLLDEFASKYAREAELEAVPLTRVRRDEQPRTQRFLDRVHDELFAFMADEVKRIKGR